MMDSLIKGSHPLVDDECGRLLPMCSALTDLDGCAGPMRVVSMFCKVVVLSEVDPVVGRLLGRVVEDILRDELK